MAAAKDLGLRGEPAAKVRKRIGDVAQRALEKLATELEIYKPTAHKKGRMSRRDADYHVVEVAENAVPVSWVERFAKIADQLRRDYVIDESADQQPVEQPEPKPAEPLTVLKLVKKRG